MSQFSLHMRGIEPSDIRKWTSVIEAAGGINLAQGNSFIEPGSEFEDLAKEVDLAIHRGATSSGFNTYSHASGVPALRQAIAKKCFEFNGFSADPDPLTGTVTVTQGATGGLICALQAIADPGDEIILFSPFYGYHFQSIRLLGLTPKLVEMKAPDFSLDFEQIEAQLSVKSRAILINTPNNPTGKVFTEAELTRLCRLCQSRGIYLISDEVYEFITYDGVRHISPASLPNAQASVITISSFSKTLAITGWRLGYVVAPSVLTERIRVVNEVLFVCAPTPLQHAIAPFVADWESFLKLGARFTRKKTLLCSALDQAGLQHTTPQGAYYVLVDLKSFGFATDAELNSSLIERYGLAGVPGSAFYPHPEKTGMVRLCFAVWDRELEAVQASLFSG